MNLLLYVIDPVGRQHFLEECLDDYNLMILSFKAAIDADQRVAPEPSQGVRQHSWRELCGGFSGLNQPLTELTGEISQRSWSVASRICSW